MVSLKCLAMKIFDKIVALCSGLVLFSCSMFEPQVPDEEPVRFTLNAAAPVDGSRASVDDSWHVSWTSGDRILAGVKERNVSGTPVSAVFSFNSGNVFGTSTELNLSVGGTYEWNVLYAKDFGSSVENPISVPYTGVAQSAPGSKAHLGNQPFYGYALSTGTASPDVQMQHLSSVICIKLKNETTSALKVKSVKLSNAEGIAMAGQFTVNCSDGSLSSVSTQAYAQISVTDGTLAAGAVGEFYVPVRPFSIAAGKAISVSLTLDSGKVLTYTKAVSANTDFSAGHVKSRSVSVKPDDLKEYYTKITSASELEAGRYLIVYESGKLALNGSNVKDGSNNGVSVTISDSKIEATESVDSYSFVLAESGSEWTIKGSDGNYIGATNNSNTLNFSKGTAFKNSITISSSSHTVKGSGGAYLRFNTDANRFRYYKSSSYSNQKPVYLYKRSGSIDSGSQGGDSGSGDSGDSGGGDSGSGDGGDSGSGSGDGGQTNVGGYLGCYEVPAITNLSGSKTTGSNSTKDDNWIRYYTTNNRQQVAVHTFTHPDSHDRVRTYVVLFDESKYAPLWTAHAAHKSMWVDKNVGRNESWGNDPAIDLDQQSGISGGSYSRGHFVASSDRQSSVLQNEQTFYYSNQAPQMQNGFNGGVWNQLESDIRGHAPTGRDTMYVVTGVLYEGTKTMNSKNGYSVPIPSHFYKLVMSCSFDTNGQMTDAKGCAYLFTNESHADSEYSDFTTTIDAIEQRAGFDFFPAVPAALQSKAESSSVGLW